MKIAEEDFKETKAVRRRSNDLKAKIKSKDLLRSTETRNVLKLLLLGELDPHTIPTLLSFEEEVP